MNQTSERRTFYQGVIAMADNGSEKPDKLAGMLMGKLPGLTVETYVFRGDTTMIVPVDKLVDVVRTLGDAFGYKLLVDMAGAHYPGREKCFEVAYVLRNVENPARCRVKVQVGETEAVPSLTVLFEAANWHEREAFDMFGIRFDGHPNLTRIFMEDDFEHHPLRKEFPLRGYN